MYCVTLVRETVLTSPLSHQGFTVLVRGSPVSRFPSLTSFLRSDGKLDRKTSGRRSRLPLIMYLPLDWSGILDMSRPVSNRMQNWMNCLWYTCVSGNIKSWKHMTPRISNVNLSRTCIGVRSLLTLDFFGYPKKNFLNVFKIWVSRHIRSIFDYYFMNWSDWTSSTT